MAYWISQEKHDFFPKSLLHAKQLHLRHPLPHCTFSFSRMQFEMTKRERRAIVIFTSLKVIGTPCQKSNPTAEKSRKIFDTTPMKNEAPRASDKNKKKRWKFCVNRHAHFFSTAKFYMENAKDYSCKKCLMKLWDLEDFWPRIFWCMHRRRSRSG